MKVSIIIPTRNESENIKILIPLLKQYGHEIVITDDSDDDTPNIAKELGVKVVVGRRLGLAQAVLDGIDAIDSDAFIVMDADLQHPHNMIPEFVYQLEYHDLVIATKHTKESMTELSAWRKLQSNLGVWAAQFLIPAPVSDPMTGFFGIRKKCLDGIPRGEYYLLNDETIQLSELSKEDIKLYKSGGAKKYIGIEAIGFKIGLELFTKAKWISHAEIPIHFDKRVFGESKGTRHSLQKHLFRLFNNSLNYEVVLPKGSEEYFAFYEANEWQKDWKQSIASILQQITSDIKPDKLLDIGCGSSPNINYVVANDKTGIDVREDALNSIKQYSPHKFLKGSVLDIPFDEYSFDCITCVEVIEHLYLPDVRKAISEISRVLKDGGFAIIATPNYSSVLWNLIENAQKYLQRGKWTSDHHTKFNRKLLNSICQEYNLEEIRYDGVMSNMDMVITYKKI